MGIVVIDSIVSYDKKFLLVSFVKIILVSLLMLAVVLILKNQVHFMVSIISGGIVYFVGAYLLGLYRWPPIVTGKQIGRAHV